MSSLLSSVTSLWESTSNEAVIFAFAFGLLSVLIAFFKKSKNKTPTVFDVKIYPIKSCAPITLPQAVATEFGFLYDRIAQVTNGKDGQYCTPRDVKCAKLFHVQPTLSQTDGDASSSTPPPTTLTLTMPGVGQTISVELHSPTAKHKTTMAVPMIGPKVKLDDYGNDVAKWLQKATNIPNARLTVIGKDYQRLVEVNPDQGEALPDTEKTPPVVSLADEAPFLLCTIASWEDLNKRLRKRGITDKMPMQRFRPNMVIAGTRPWEEDSWKLIQIGTVQFNVWQRCGRCAMTTIHRDSLKRGPEPLATLSTFRERAHGQRNFGMHLIPVKETVKGGSTPVIKVGDKLAVLEYNEERRAEWKRLFG